MKRHFKIYKLNNAGMSFVELLVAVLILAIIVAPFMHSFVTGAQTNASAKELMTATTLCEDAMEEFEALSIEELERKTDAEGNAIFVKKVKKSTGVVTMTAKGDYFEEGASKYKVQVLLDPREYATTYNNSNVSDFQAFNADATGVYTMFPEDDNEIYSLFYARSSTVPVDGAYETCDIDYFRENLSREIRVTLSSRGNISVVTEGETKLIRQVSVSVDIIYSLDSAKRGPNGKKPLQNDDLEYIVHKDIYDNTSSQKEFDSIYLLYTPRFLPSGNEDMIRIMNNSNIEGTFYVIRQETDRDSYGLNNLSNYKGVIQLEENPSGWGSNAADLDKKNTAMSIRTNLFNDVSVSGIKFEPRLKIKSSNILYKTPVESLLKAMNCKTADGRSFNDTGIKNRIYSMTVNILKGSDVIYTMTGTKTE